ncbi:MAG: hypothetical protein J6A36_02790 [Clostridia bacterium]|nr:hypothetical protein [Clostridia bacterium]
MEVSKEKLSELAEDFKKLRVIKSEEGLLQIRDSAIASYEKLSNSMDIIEENFQYFAKQPNSIMYPDEFILAMKFLPNGSKILSDNLEFILEKITHRAERVRPELIDIPEVSEKVADNFEKIFYMMMPERISKKQQEHAINPDMRYVACCPGTVESNFLYLMRYLMGSDKASEVLEANKNLFLNSDFNSAMANMVKCLAQDEKCHEFIRNNFETIKENCYVPDLAKLYASIKDACPEEYKQEAFLIDNIYNPAKRNANPYEVNSIDKICSRLIEQGRTKDLESLMKFAMSQSLEEPNTLKYLGCGWFNITVQAGDKAIKLGAPDDEKEKPKIPYHPRLLQPIVRKNDISRDSKHPVGIEIYEVVDTDTEISDEEILEVYKELREAGIKWTDIKKENLGRLRKNNYPYEFGYNVPVPQEFLGIEDSGVERKVLKAGQLVIIDLDCLQMAENERGNDFTKTAVVPDCVRKYEAEYQKSIEAKKLVKKPEMPEEH